MNVEYGGPGIVSLSINARKTLTTMSAELSAEFASFEPDDVLIDWVRSRSAQAFEPVYPDKDAKYFAVREVDLSALEPLVAYPDTVVQNSRPVKEASGIRIDQAYIGSCANMKSGQSAPARTIPPQLLKIVDAGGIFALLEKEGAITPKS